MASVAEKTRLTPNDLLKMPFGDHFELVDGELVELNMGAESCLIAGKLIARLVTFVDERDLGFVFPETGFQCFADDPDRIRKPDVSFVRKGRLPGDVAPKGFVTVPPDLAVEVLSPHDLVTEVNRKISEYQQADVPLIWIIDPDVRSILVYRANGTVAQLREQDDELNGEDILPGFRCRVGDLFPATSTEPSVPRE